MATKNQCKRALSKIHHLAELVDNSGGGYYDVELVAPKGMNWNGIHAFVTRWAASMPKAEFWEQIIINISDLDRLVVCSPETCSEWMDGRCDVWDV